MRIRLLGPNESDNTFRYLVLCGILLRNLFTFYATSLYTLYAAKFKQETVYNNDPRLNTKLSVINMEVVMTHKMPFNQFKLFIC